MKPKFKLAKSTSSYGRWVVFGEATPRYFWRKADAEYWIQCNDPVSVAEGRDYQIMLQATHDRDNGPEFRRCVTLYNAGVPGSRFEDAVSA